MDPLSFAVGAGLIAIGWIGGRFGSRRRTGSKNAVTARCGHGHDLAMHDRETGKCHAQLRRKDIHELRVWVGCNCRRYTGPKPLEEVFSPPIVPPES
ncbi:hypothetical protein [Nocardia grenadensis]|uniref:hypothetical protein n=1 Tax=Nocardia grenadensis TaxID=931537 RepID=UPI003D944BF8